MTETVAEVHTDAVFQVLDLGLTPFAETLARQEELVRLRLLGAVPDTLILVEHPPVVTLGRAKLRANLLLDPDELRRRGVEYFEITRGGDVTYHAPGQLVGYPIIDLRQHGRDVLLFCRGMETMLIAVLADFGISASAIPGKAGVWIGDRKIASLGISVRRWVTLHGFALNVSMDLSGFEVIRPCGEDPGIMTSMAATLGGPVSMPEVCCRVAARFAETFRLPEVFAVPEVTGGLS
ncbi:MAG TPA: lipoyl(octanoyl) transferase LipB [Candidatus Methylomirabilis sp.]|nr:lipoyl(octanoyl) transferase LipB [Candidatus Methylomirabilis sp.]